MEKEQINSAYICTRKFPEPEHEADKSFVNSPDTKYCFAYRDTFVFILPAGCIYV